MSSALTQGRYVQCDFPHPPVLDNQLTPNSLRLASPEEVTTVPQGLPTPYNGVENE